MGANSNISHSRLISLLLVMITLVTFWRVRECEFINCDDPIYVSENPHIRDGLTWEGIEWAFSNQIVPSVSNGDWWSPMAFLSHMGDFQIYGLNASGHHLTNLLIHVLNVVLLFGILFRMTGSLWRSACVAALFAAHPIHVQSVAWIINRKVLLSTFFGFLMIYSYVRYVENQTTRRYGFILAAFTLGLMSKMTIATLPFALLLLDYWPLKRVGLSPIDRRAWSKVIMEKIPLLGLSIISCLHALTYMHRMGSLQHLDQLPMVDRISNALVSYLSYLQKMIWPSHFAIFYPHPEGSIPFGQVACAAILLGFLSILALLLARRFPYLMVGWLWYVGNLVPTSGIVQVGAHAMADRYAYVPFMGLFIMAAWGLADGFDWIKRKQPAQKAAFSAAGIVAASLLFAVLIVCSWIQVGYWRNSIVLFEHACRVTKGSFLVHYNLGTALNQEKKFDEAIHHLRQALRFNPFSPGTHDNIGIALVHKGRINEGIEFHRRALQIKPEDAGIRFNLADALVEANRMDEAITNYVQGLSLNPEHAHAHRNFGTVLASRNQLDEAIRHYQVALHLAPDDAKAHYNLGSCLMQQGKLDQARAHLEAAVNLQPDPATAEFARRALDKLRARQTHPAPQP